MGHHDTDQDQPEHGRDRQPAMPGGPATTGGMNPNADEMTGGTGSTGGMREPAGTSDQGRSPDRALDDQETWGQGSEGETPRDR